MKNKNNEIPKDKYSLLSKLGSKLNLSFSSHLLLGNKIIALDGIRKKLLVADVNDLPGQPCIIELDKIKGISLKKSYSSIKPGALSKKGIEEFLQTIRLLFQYKDEEKKIGLTFFERGKNNFYDLAVGERNAKNWQLILSKMILPKVQR